jgi:hypothetical protein
MLYKPFLHGTYIEDIFFGVIFVIMLVVFLYFYFSDKGESDTEEDMGDSQKLTPSDALPQSREER